MADSSISKLDGTVDFSGGVNSLKPTTIKSEQNPNGLMRNELAWLDNGTVRDGGVTQIWGWQRIGMAHDGSAIYQGGFMYQPDSGNPYLVVSIGGRIYRVDPDTGTVIDLSSAFGLVNPPLQEYAYFEQAEQFLIIQAGDNVTLPLFWDGATLRRSIGITNTAVAPGTPGINEIPAATAMCYYMNRLWYAQGRQYSAGDIVRGTSGTLAYNFRDSVLNVTENPLVLGGDGFTIPTNAGNIRALKYGAAIDAALGEGRLFIFSRKQVFALRVPVTRGDWIAATNDNQPLQTVIQQVNGSVNDRSVVAVNGDLFYQSLDPGIRSLMQSVRYFDQWGNIDISANENRVLQFNDRNLMRFSSGIEFDNRLLETLLPKQTPQGVVSQAIVPLDFRPISSFGAGHLPNWEGIYEGLDFLQLFTGDFGRERAFGLVVSRETGSIDLWELPIGTRFQNGDNRVDWLMEFPAFTWAQYGWENEIKRLLSAEIWIDRLFGTVLFELDWRPDGTTCWIPWHKWTCCSPKNSAETPFNPISYPIADLGDCYRSTMTIPTPPDVCANQMFRPAAFAYQHQARLKIHGFCRVRGFWLVAEKKERKLYENLQQ